MTDTGRIEPAVGKFRELCQHYEPKLGRFDEVFVQKLWRTQAFFHANLESIDRRLIRVLKPGTWNHGEGPDFLNAEIEIDGTLHVGDVEIHVKSSEWYTHKHHLNSRYNRVILHTIFFNDDFNLRTRLQNGKRVPMLELLKFIDVPTGALFDEMQAADVDAVSYCQVSGHELNMAVLRGVFDSLGRERFLEKAESMRLLRTRLDFEQLLYEGIMEALGYRDNSTPLRDLAQRVPFAHFDNKSELEIQAMLFGVAGLLPSQLKKPIPSNEREHPFIVGLEELWSSSKDAAHRERMSESQWRFATRPFNHPTRRIAAMAQLIHHCQGSLMMHFLPTCERIALENTPKSLRAIQKELLALLTLEPEGYWKNHSNFGKPAREATLIGQLRALDIVVNKILPMVYIWAVEAGSRGLQEAILQLYDGCATLQKNRYIRKIEEQIFTKAQPMRSLKLTAKIQQGAIRLYKNYCADRLCHLCPILEHDAILAEAAPDIPFYKNKQGTDDVQ